MDQVQGWQNTQVATAPLVSCIMPTADRASFIPQAIACFLAQDYDERELLVLDNGREPIEHLIPRQSNIRYQRVYGRFKLGELRNQACELAQGAVVVHWDDDDWYPANRISVQVRRLIAKDVALCATSRLYFLREDGSQAWEFHSGGARPWLAGSSLAYWRWLWQRQPFEHLQVGEDARFVARVSPQQIVDLADPALVIATVHRANTSPKRPAGSAWRTVSAEALRAMKDGQARSSWHLASAVSAKDDSAGAPGGAAPDSASDRPFAGTVCIGVHERGDWERLRATLGHVLEHTLGRNIDLLVLLDGAEAGLAERLARYPRVTVSASAHPRGAAACFNRMLRERSADLYVFLESGSLVGPGWLQHLQAALDASPKHGLAGPTTNRAWSKQGQLPGSLAAKANPGNVPQVARELQAREGTPWESLAPLYCLADFCYAVKHAVVAAIGAADEGYGTGPCWEMDYTARAVRAGFGAVWARAAYVFRLPFGKARAFDEPQLLPRNKERYQRKFCGQWLRGERDEPAEHCRGEACEHFAPAAALALHLPLRPGAAEAEPPLPAQKLVDAAAQGSTPLVTCIMPTGGREAWLHQSLRYFARQDYARRELVIVDSGRQSIADQLPCDARIRYFHRPELRSIGAKRNFACEQARGEVVVHWDDDDWYGPDRIALQVAPLIAGSADITALTDTPFFEVERQTFWRCTPTLFARMFVQAVHGGTLAWHRRLFSADCRFPETSLAEDAAFLTAALARRARLQALEAPESFVYVRHGSNAWRFACGTGRDSGWLAAQPPAIFAADLAFYRAQADASLRAA